MRRKIVAGNWKMNVTAREAQVIFAQINEGIESIPKDVGLIICPPSVYLSLFNKINKNKSVISIGAQNCFYEQSGAFTGELSPDILRSVGVDYCIIGHSERRAYFGEDNEMLRKKVIASLSVGLTPIYCVGESLEQRESGEAQKVVSRQLADVLSHVESDRLNEIIVAYEPVWAIGTGKTAAPEQAQEMHAHIRKELNGIQEKAGDEMTILYGGSCKPENASEIFSQEDVDGGLIGGASLKSGSFLEVAKSY